MATNNTNSGTTNGFRIGNVELPSLDQLTGALPVDTDRVLGMVRDAAYVVIGFGVLTVQQIQSRTRDLFANLESNPAAKHIGFDRSQIDELVARFESQFASLDERFEALEAKLDTAIDKVGGRLPEQAAEVLGQAHDIAKTARKQVRGLLRAV
jgi:hypothetical protein